jgi:hypothetical protein
MVKPTSRFSGATLAGVSAAVLLGGVLTDRRRGPGEVDETRASAATSSPGAWVAER